MSEQQLPSEQNEAPIEENKEENKEEPKKPFLVKFTRDIHDLMEMFVFSAIAVIMLFSIGVRQCVVRGGSMEQTLYDGERLMVVDIGYEPQQGDIIVFHQTDRVYGRFNEPIVKRVIATEGQWVDIDRRAQTVTVYDENRENPQVLDESAYRYLDTGEWTADLEMNFPVQVPENCVFVMGDNRNNSSDSSTESIIGFVDERRILGKVVLRATPFSKAGPVY